MQVPLNRIHHLFVTHEHTDHILGVIWMIRMIGTAIKKGNYEGIFHIYCHNGLIDTIQTFCRLTLQKKFCDLIGDPIQLIPVSNRETRQILDMEVTFFDIHSTKARQFGFRAVLPDGLRLENALDGTDAEPLRLSPVSVKFYRTCPQQRRNKEDMP